MGGVRTEIDMMAVCCEMGRHAVLNDTPDFTRLSCGLLSLDSISSYQECKHVVGNCSGNLQFQ